MNTKLQHLVSRLLTAFTACSFLICTNIEPRQQAKDYTAYSYQLTKHEQQEQQCLREAIWHEARGEPLQGINAVASVIYNRKQHKDYPGSFCKVINQHKQFSYILQRKARGLGLKPVARTQEDQKVLEYIDWLSSKMVQKQFKPSLPPKVLWYTTKNVKVQWQKQKKVYVMIGNHKFFG